MLMPCRLDAEEKKISWEALDKVARGAPRTKKLFIGVDFNGNIGSLTRDYHNVHGGIGFSKTNKQIASLLDFVQVYGLMALNSSFPKKEVHLVGEVEG